MNICYLGHEDVFCNSSFGGVVNPFVYGESGIQPNQHVDEFGKMNKRKDKTGIRKGKIKNSSSIKSSVFEWKVESLSLAYGAIIRIKRITVTYKLATVKRIK